MPLTPGQIITGSIGSYKIVEKLQDSVWLANVHPAGEKVVVKYVEHFRLHTERQILRRFQGRTPFLRPLIDEGIDGHEWSPLVFRYLDDDLLHMCHNRPLTRDETKQVAKAVLEGLKVLHQDGYVHSDIKPSNVLVNYGPPDKQIPSVQSRPPDKQITDVQLADFGSTVHVDSRHARDGDMIGSPIFRSPEAALQMRWGTATDVWSFGAMIISLLYGRGFHIFKPDVPFGHDEYEVKILMKQYQCFGPFPLSYQEIADPERLGVLTWVMENTPPGSLKPFHLTTSREISSEDKEFVLKIMKLDPRDRPTVVQLLADKWFNEI